MSGVNRSDVWPVLFSDASELDSAHDHRKVIGVTNLLGELLAWRELPTPRLPINLAEMEGVLLAIECIEGERGVLLTDSLDAAKWLSGNSHKLPYTKCLDELLVLRQRMKDTWPSGWVVGWIPERQNLAHRSVVSKARELLGPAVEQMGPEAAAYARAAAENWKRPETRAAESRLPRSF